jgi:glycosyltransferase involved in cell wall biosynthesis
MRTSGHFGSNVPDHGKGDDRDLAQPHGTGPDHPLVSVVIPVFNRARFLPQAVESVLAQDHRPLEVIVVDDGSTDGTPDLVGAHDFVTCIRQPHRGVSSARNAGVAASRGSILAFLDSDDLWPPRRLTVAVRHFLAHPEVGYVLGRQVLFAEPGCPVPPWVKPEWLAEPQDASNTGVLLARRETLSRVGPFNTDYAAGEDTEWLVRASEAGVPMTRLCEVLVHRRLHGANLSAETIETRKATLARVARESILRRRNREIP